MGIVEGSRAYMALPPETRDALQEIEHIRWCRFNYLNGWTYAPGTKDKRARTHPDLVPYDELTADRSKDADAYLTLGLMIRSVEEQAELEGIWLGRQ